MEQLGSTGGRLTGKQGSCVGLYFNNRPEWLLVDHACSAYSYISVPLYDTLGSDAVKFVVNQAAVQVIFCVPQTLKNLLSFLPEIPSVHLIVVVGASDDQMASLPLQTNVEIITYRKLQIQGNNYPKSFCPPKPEDIATICYTSGTTGMPKGAVLSHKNLIANVAGQSLRMTFYPSDIYISYLPLAHIFERATQIILAYYGVGVGFYQGVSNSSLQASDSFLLLIVMSSLPGGALKFCIRYAVGFHSNLLRRKFPPTSAVVLYAILRIQLSCRIRALDFNPGELYMFHGCSNGRMKEHKGKLSQGFPNQTIPSTYFFQSSYLLLLPSPSLAASSSLVIGNWHHDSLKLMDDMAYLRPTIFFSVPRVFNRLYAGIMNAVKSSGVLRERLFNAAYSAKKQAILSGKYSSSIWDSLIFNKIKGMVGGRIRYMVSAASPLSPDVLEFLRVYGFMVLFSEIKLVDIPEMGYRSADQPHPRGEICVRGPTVFQGYYKDEAHTREMIAEDGWLYTGDIGVWLPEGRLKIIDRKKNIFKLAQGEYVAPEKIESIYVNCKFVAQCFVHGDSLKSSLVAIVSLDQDVLKAWAAAEGIKIKRPQAKAYFSKAIAEMYTEISKSPEMQRV
ncbi:hypothetical protein Ccrd_020146 [Cynara cardunculus var. scolymus]|uniref:Uncharacterized protein n=1 Tax=Cynara cardunculus var. scolymus TaxID=59895 RepID=A0A103Y314_CYNCS|nr:hypothetical protein Ccrd_020146 [Cynara cardunculus var. scolymus]